MPNDGSPLLGLSQRLPPSNQMAEQALLGALLANNKAYERVAEFLAPEHFADPIHGRIYQAISRRVEAGQLADPVTLKAEFEHAGILEGVGGVACLVHLLSSNVGGATTAGAYGRAIHDAWLRRQAIDIGETMISAALGIDPDSSGETVVTETMEQLLSLGERSKTTSSTDFAKAVSGAVERAEAAYKGDPGFTRLDTGIRSVDRLWAGLWPGQLYLVMARSNTGKTPFMLQIARNIAAQFRAEALATKKPPRHVHVWSLEMTAGDLANVNLASVTRWTADQIKAGEIGDGDAWWAFRQASNEVGQLPIIIDDGAETDMPTLARRTRIVARQKATGLVCVDFRELVRRGKDQARMPLQEWMPYLCYQLKGVAKAANVPLIALAQINKPEKGMAVGFPGLGDLPYGGEQAADGLFALHRPGLYMPETMPAPARSMTAEKIANMQSAWDQDRKAVANLCEFGVVKRRFGPRGTTKLHFDGPRMLLSEWNNGLASPDFLNNDFPMSESDYGH